MTAGVVLAAGRSARMGRPKAFLPHFSPQTTFLSHICHGARAGGARPILVVGRPADEALTAEVARLGCVYVENAAPERGQLSSLIAALDALAPDPPDGVIVLPVDVPLITPGVVAQLLSAAHVTTAPIVRAAYRGRHGHPVLFRRTIFDELRAADQSRGARTVVRADPGRVIDVETDEPGVLVDVDTPDDYVRIFGRAPAS